VHPFSYLGSPGAETVTKHGGGDATALEKTSFENGRSALKIIQQVGRKGRAKAGDTILFINAAPEFDLLKYAWAQRSTCVGARRNDGAR